MRRRAGVAGVIALALLSVAIPRANAPQGVDVTAPPPEPFPAVARADFVPPGVGTTGAVGPAAAAEARAAARAEGVHIAAGEELQQVIDAHPPGTTFLLGAGMHREQGVRARDGDAFVGEEGAVLSGARLLDSFERAGDHWAAAAPAPRIAPHGSCREERPGCVVAERVYLDDEPLEPAAGLAGLESGRFLHDAEGGRVLLADDPTGRRVELATTRHAFSGDAADVRIEGLVIEKYANPAQSGAIQAGGPGWLVRANELRRNHGYGVRVANETRVLANYVHHNGQLGMGGVGDDVLVEGNEVAFNNTAGFLSGWEAGGGKFTRTRNLVLAGNSVHHNEGPGWWTDIDTIDTRVENNLVEWNTHEGIKHEISHAARIEGNIVRFNGREFDIALWGAQILVQNSSNVRVIGNVAVVAADGGDGIGVIHQGRGGGPLGEWLTRDNELADNEVIHLGRAGQSGIFDDAAGGSCGAAAGNVFSQNLYRVATTEVSHWVLCGASGWEPFLDGGQEPDGERRELGE